MPAAGREIGGAHGDAVGLDVVRVPVAAVVVVGDEDLGAGLEDHLDEVFRGLVHIGLPEAAGSSLSAMPIIPESP